MVCRICNQEKTEDFFYISNKHPCKDCIKERVRLNRINKIDYYRDYDRNRPNKEERIQLRKEYKNNLRENNPEKYDAIFHGTRKRNRKNNPDKIRANGIINDMLRYGKLTRPDKCSLCGVFCKPQAHHPDYSKPKEVIWLCVKCHSQIHKKIREEQRSLQKKDKEELA